MKKSLANARAHAEAFKVRKRTPYENCYWLPGGRVLAGEYPGAVTEEEAHQKLLSLLLHGVRSFVDLTEETDPLLPYEPLLRNIKGYLNEDVRYRRMPIRDMDVCGEDQMREILDYIEDEIGEDRVVYVHCWGGIGRTGTVVGCWFVRAGIPGDEALARVAALWSGMSDTKRRRHPEGSPQTEAQRSFVRSFRDERAGQTEAARLLDRSRRARGCLLGGAIGDALGAPVEFLRLDEIRGRYGPDGIAKFDVAYGSAGAITDDTQMTLFTAEGLLRAAVSASQLEAQAPATIVHRAYLRWLETQGTPSPRKDEGEPSWLMALDALHQRRAPGNTCLGALQSGQMGTVENRINNSKGCGGVMRAAPAGIVEFAGGPFKLGCEIAAITHGHPSGYLSAGALALMIDRLLRGSQLLEAVEEVITCLKAEAGGDECVRALEAALSECRSGRPASAERVETLGAGWVAEEALAIAVYCALVAGRDFEKGVRLAVNHSGDSDSTGAIAGNLLGALLGEEAIPREWVDGVELRDVILEVADDLVVGWRDGEGWVDRWPGA